MNYFVSLEFFFFPGILSSFAWSRLLVFSFCLILCLFLWTRQNSYLSWSCEGRHCVCLVALVGSSNWSEQESGGHLFSLFLFKKFFLSCVTLIQGLSQWLTCNTGDAGNLGSILESERSPGGGHGNPLQYSCLEYSTDRGAWWAMIRGVVQSWTRLKRLSRAKHWF